MAYFRNAKRKYDRGGGHGCLVGIMYAAFVLGISMFLAAICISAANEVFAFVQPDRTAVVDVPAEPQLNEVADLLHDSGIIEYPALFKLYCKLSNKEDAFNEGRYELNANMDYSSLIRNMRRTSSSRMTQKVTVPEGYTTKQIVALLAENEICNSDDLWETIREYDFEYDFLTGRPKDETRLEGYLFPDTYEFYIGDSASNVLEKFLDNFDKRYSEELRQKTEDRSMTMDEVIIIASLIENEAKLNEDRPRIASVIYNRLADTGNFPYLQIDATIKYITGTTPTPEDLTIDSPYNTYMYGGLPPTAISNPGLASIKAALNPDDTNYYYYVAKSDGSHIFSTTLAEHNAAIASLNS